MAKNIEQLDMFGHTSEEKAGLEEREEKTVEAEIKDPILSEEEARREYKEKLERELRKVFEESDSCHWCKNALVGALCDEHKDKIEELKNKISDTGL